MGHFLDALGDDVDMIKIGDDLGTEQSLLMSPAMYRRILKPIHADYIAFIQARTKARIFFHTDGDVFDLLDDLVEIGVDILNPVQSGSGKLGNLAEVKRRYGEPPRVLWCDRHPARPAERDSRRGPRRGPARNRHPWARRWLSPVGGPHAS